MGSCGKGWLCKNFHDNLLFPLKSVHEGKLRNEEVAQRGGVSRKVIKMKYVRSCFYIYIILREGKFGEVGLKEDNLKSKFPKQVRQDGTQSTSGGVFNRGGGANFSVTGGKDKVIASES